MSLNPVTTRESDASRSILNLPNTITVFRILCVPVFINLLIYGRFGYALALFLVAVISDGIDGWIARWFNQRSRLGLYLDPLADKVLSTSAFIALSILQHVPVWLATIVVSRDLLLALATVLFHLLALHFDILPSWLGKVTTVLQFGYIVAVLAAVSFTWEAWGREIAGPVALAVAAATVGSGLHYLWRWTRMLRAEPVGR
jgi:cardiolipin synthase